MTAVLAPLAVLAANGVTWQFPMEGAALSLVVGTIGAFCVLLAFGAKGTPAAVMAIVFAGAPIVNAIVSLSMHPPAGGMGALRWQFVAGIVLAALGGCMVTLYKPPPGQAASKAPQSQQHVETAKR